MKYGPNSWIFKNKIYLDISFLVGSNNFVLWVALVLCRVLTLTHINRKKLANKQHELKSSIKPREQ